MDETDTDPRHAKLLLRLIWITLSVAFAPFPLSFEAEEVRQEDLFYNSLTNAVESITSEVSALQRDTTTAPPPQFLQRVASMCITIEEIYAEREALIDLATTNGMKNLRRLQDTQITTSALAGHIPPSTLSLHDQTGRSLLWTPFLHERGIPPTDASDLGITGPSTQQLLPPGGVALVRAWDREIQAAAAEIDVHRSAQQVDAEPLYVPAFDTAALETQTFTEASGLKCTVMPVVVPDEEFMNLAHEVVGMDDHSLELYNRVAERWTGESRGQGVHVGKEFWRVVRELEKHEGERPAGSGDQ